LVATSSDDEITTHANRSASITQDAVEIVGWDRLRGGRYREPSRFR
jgi:hypothetical protein